MMFTPLKIWGTAYIVPQTITPDDLLRLPDEGTKNELYEGVLVKEEMTASFHGSICQRLGGYLFVYGQSAGFTNQILQNTLFNLTPTGSTAKTVLAPDLAILQPSGHLSNNVTTDVPLIAMEVVSPSQTLAELGIKAVFYRNVGVEEVWIIDPNTRVIEIWNTQGITTLNDTQTLTSALLPGFSLAVNVALDG